MAEQELTPRQAELPIFGSAAEDDAAAAPDSRATDTDRRRAVEERPRAPNTASVPGLRGVDAEASANTGESAVALTQDDAPVLLDRTIIGAVVLRELDRAITLYPDWAHPFAGLSFNRARRCYGQAHRDGRMVLSTIFIGTAALEDLEDTVRHEFAHLIAGVEARHGPRWRTVAKKLGAVPKATGRSRSADLDRRMDDAPWTLVAILASGEERELKPAFRRNRRFLDYRLGDAAQRYRCAGQDVLRFVYRRRQAS